MKFLYIIDPLESLNIASDTTLAIMAEAGSRGVENFVGELNDIFVLDGRLQINCSQVLLRSGYQALPTYLSAKHNHAADDFRVIFMRKDPPVDELFISSLLMLRCYNPSKTLMINHPDGLLVANEKLFGQQIAPQFYPPTLVSAQVSVLRDFISQHEKVVLKPLYGAGGSGVLVFAGGDQNLSSALELLSNGFSRPIMMQAYVPEARLGDKRILILGGEPLGAVLRVPVEGDHRANFHAGGRAQACEITAKDRELIAHLKPSLLRLGLHLVGIDIIGDFLTEINVTSPTCIRQMEELGARGLSARVMDYLDKLIA